MKLFIAIDLEGISGVVSEADTAREGAAAQRARAHMRADLDAVLDGCAAAGAGEVVVCDAHDDGRNLDPTGLPGSVTLMSGSPAPLSMLEGLGAGLRRRALRRLPRARRHGCRRARAHLELQGVPAPPSATSRSASSAWPPCSPASSACRPSTCPATTRRRPRRARSSPGIATTVVKTGVRREAAALCSPEEARARMRADVEAALRADPWPAPLAWNGEPLRLTFTRVQFCDLAEACPGTTRTRRAHAGDRRRPRSPRCTRGSSPACGSPSWRVDEGGGGRASSCGSARAVVN